MPGSINIRLLAEPGLLNGYQIPQRAKSLVADAAHDDQMLRAAKRAVLFPVFYDALGQGATDAGKFFQLRSGSGVNVNS